MKPYEEMAKNGGDERQPAETRRFGTHTLQKETEAYRAILTENTGKLAGTQGELADGSV
jgi:hypothetical protein